MYRISHDIHRNCEIINELLCICNKLLTHVGLIKQSILYLPTMSYKSLPEWIQIEWIDYIDPHFYIILGWLYRHFCGHFGKYMLTVFNRLPMTNCSNNLNG